MIPQRYIIASLFIAAMLLLFAVVQAPRPVSAGGVSSVDALDHAVISLGHNARVPLELFGAETLRLLATGAAFRQLGAGALMLAYVAAGRFEGYYEWHMWPWDAVAGLAMIAAAGGRYAPYLHGPIAEGGLVLANNALLHDTLIATIRPGHGRSGG